MARLGPYSKVDPIRVGFCQIWPNLAKSGWRRLRIFRQALAEVDPLWADVNQVCPIFAEFDWGSAKLLPNSAIPRVRPNPGRVRLGARKENWYVVDRTQTASGRGPDTKDFREGKTASNETFKKLDIPAHPERGIINVLQDQVAPTMVKGYRKGAAWAHLGGVCSWRVAGRPRGRIRADEGRFRSKLVAHSRVPREGLVRARSAGRLVPRGPARCLRGPGFLSRRCAAFGPLVRDHLPEGDRGAIR